MSKKLILLFTATFIIALAIFGVYFIVQKIQEVQGVDGEVKIGSDVNFLGWITISGLPDASGDDEPIKIFDATYPPKLGFKDGTSITSWCDVNDFTWCIGGGYDPPPDDPPVGCFTAQTPILMADGIHKPIKDVKEGDWVLTKENDKSDKMVSAKVLKTSRHTAYSYLVINKELEVTDIHPIFVNGQWKQAWTIRLGNKLLSEKGQEVIVNSLEIKREKVEVYNLEIEGYNTYFSGGFYVHNKPYAL